MTTSVWNKAEIESSFGAYTTLQEVITHLETEISKKGEVVCEIRVNGHALDEDDETQIASMHFGSLESLVVYSTEPALLVQQALQSSISFVPHVQQSCVKTSEHFRAANMHLAHTDFTQTLEGCFWLIDTLKHIRGASSGSPVTGAAVVGGAGATSAVTGATSVATGTAAANGPSMIAARPLVNLTDWNEAEIRFVTVVREVVSAYELKDFVLVADLLEYELSEAIGAWKPVLQVQVVA